MTRDKSLEATVLLQDILIVLAAMMLSRGAHALLVNLVPRSSRPWPPGTTRTCSWSFSPPGSSRPTVSAFTSCGH
jgi:hypothetical protein